MTRGADRVSSPALPPLVIPGPFLGLAGVALQLLLADRSALSRCCCVGPDEAAWAAHLGLPAWLSWLRDALVRCARAALWTRDMDERPLWAPWRIEYIKSPKAGECLFCAAAARRDSRSDQVVETGNGCFTMVNAFPDASGHVMVAPYRHVGELDALDEAEQLELMVLARRAVAALHEVMAPRRLHAGFNIGKVAGAGYADHLHLHVLPRWRGDTNFMPVLGGTRVISQALDETRDALVAALCRVP